MLGRKQSLGGWFGLWPRLRKSLREAFDFFMLLMLRSLGASDESLCAIT